MSGNVEEWCSDNYASYSNQDAVDPTVPTPTGYGKVVRGGDYNSSESHCTCTYRNYMSASYSSDYNGFRLASY